MYLGGQRCWENLVFFSGSLANDGQADFCSVYFITVCYHLSNTELTYLLTQISLKCFLVNTTGYALRAEIVGIYIYAIAATPCELILCIVNVIRT